MKLDLKTTLILLSVLLVAAVGSAFVTSWVFSTRIPAQTAGPMAMHELSADFQGSMFDPRLVWHTGTLTANLAPTSGGLQRFVKTGMSIHANDMNSFTELTRREVQVRDRIITILRTTSSDQLADEKGISRLKERIMESIQDLLLSSGGTIREIYLTELVIQ